MAETLEGTAERVDVGADVEEKGVPDLGRHVGPGADALGMLPGGGDAVEGAEVEQDGDAVGESDVLALDVAVELAEPVQPLKCCGDAVDDALEFLAAELLRQTRCVLHDEPGRAVRRFAAFVPLGHEAGQRLVLDELAFAEELVARGCCPWALVDLDDGDGEGCGGPMDETDRS